MTNFKLVKDKYHIPVIIIENEKDIGFMSIFRNYQVQISGTMEGICDMGSSFTKSSDFVNISKNILIRHIKECLINNKKSTYSFDILFDDIPDDIMEAFINASIEASNHWDELIRGTYIPNNLIPMIE